MNEIKFPNNICEHCKRTIQIKDLYVIYKVAVVSNNEYHFITMPRLIEEMNDFVSQQGYHLSASQIILLRPDILKVFLNKKFYPEEILFWFMMDEEICNICYSGYIQTCPER